MKLKIGEGISMIEKSLNPPGKPNTSFIKLFILLRRMVPDLNSIPLFNYVVEYQHNIFNEHHPPFEDMDQLQHRILETWYRYIGFIPREGENDLQNIPDIVEQLEDYTPLDEFLTNNFKGEHNNERDQYIRNQIPKSEEIENLRNYLEFADDISQLSTEMDSLSHSRIDDNHIEPVHEQTIYIYKKKIFTDKKKLDLEKQKLEKQQKVEQQKIEPRVVLEIIPPIQPTLVLHQPKKVDKKLAVQTIKLEHKKNKLKNVVVKSPLEINKEKDNTKEKKNLLNMKTGNIVSTIKLHVKKKLKELYKHNLKNLNLPENQLNSTELEALPNATNSDNSTSLVVPGTNSTIPLPKFNATEFEKQIDDMEIEDEDVIDMDENLNRLEPIKEEKIQMEEEDDDYKDNYDPYIDRGMKRFQQINKLNRTAIADLIKDNPEYQYKITHFYDKYKRFENETENNMMEQINLYMEKYGTDEPYMETFINMQKLAEMGDWDIMALHQQEVGPWDYYGNKYSKFSTKVSQTFDYLWRRLVDFSKLVVFGFVENMFKYDNFVKMAVMTLAMGGVDFSQFGIFSQGLRAYNHISRFVVPFSRYRRYMQNRDSLVSIALNEFQNYQLDRQFQFMFNNPVNIIQNQYIPPLRAYFNTPGNLMQHIGNELANFNPNYNRPLLGNGNQLMEDMARAQIGYQQQYYNRARQALDLFKNEDRIRRNIQDNIMNYNNRLYRDDTGFVYENYVMGDLGFHTRQDFYSSNAFLNNGRWRLANLLKKVGKRILFGKNQGQ